MTTYRKWTTSAMTAVLFAMQGMLSGASDEANLSFEADEAGTTSVPAGWHFPAVPTVGLEIQKESPGPDTGENCLMVDFSNAEKSDWSRVFTSAFLPIEPSQRYIQTFWLKTEGATPDKFGISVGRLYYDEAQQLIPHEDYNARYMVRNIGNTEWEKYSVVLTPSESGEYSTDSIPANARYVRLMFVSYGYNARYWIDDLRFEPYRETAGHFLPSDRTIIHATPAEGVITPDGSLSEAAWKNETNWSSPFLKAITNDPEPGAAENQTRFKVVYDRHDVYFGIRGEFKNKSQLTAKTQEDQSYDLFSDDCLEIFIDPSGKRSPGLQIGVNPNGKFATLFHGPKDLDITVASRVFDNHWDLEVRIPKKTLKELFGSLEEVPTYWNINVCRHQPAQKDRFSSWSLTRDGFGNPGGFGILVLGDQAGLLQRKAEELAGEIRSAIKTKVEPHKQSPVAGMVQKAGEIEELHFFVEYLTATLPAQGPMPEYLFQRYLSELQAIPAALDRLLGDLERIAFSIETDANGSGVVFFPVALTASTKEDSYPEEGGVSQHRMRMALNEVHSSRISLFSGVTLNDVTVEVPQLKDEKGATIPEGNLDVRIVHRWGDGNQADILATDLRVPLEGWLENYDKHPRWIPEIKEHTSRHLLVQVDTHGVAPGLYRSTLKLTAGDGRALQLPLEVEVLPFELKKTEREVGFFYHGVLFGENRPKIGTHGSVFYNGLTTPESMRLEFEHLVRSGFNHVVLPAYADGPFDPSYLREVLSIAAKAGLTRVTMTGAEHLVNPKLVEKGGPDLDAAIVTLEERLAKLSEIAREVGVSVTVYGQDEPNDEVHVRTNQLIFTAAKKVGLQTSVAIMRDDIRKQLEGQLDMLVMNWILMSQSGELAKELEAGTTHSMKTTFYANLKASQATVIRMTTGWYLYKSKMNGAIPWAYYFLGSEWEPFADYGSETSRNCSYYVFPTKDRPLSTLKFEAMREGVNDLRYLETLEEHLARHGDSKRAAEVKRKLQTMLDTFSLGNPKGTQSENFQLPPLLYEKYRKKVQDLIVALNRPSSN